LTILFNQNDIPFAELSAFNYYVTYLSPKIGADK